MLQKHLLHSGEAEARRSMYEKAGEMAAGMRKRFFPSQANEPWPSPSIGYGNTIVAKMISPETSSGIEHPLQRFFTHRLGEKLLQVIAVKSEVTGLALFLPHSQQLLTRQARIVTAFEADYNIEPVVRIGSGHLLPIQHRQVPRRVMLRQSHTEVRRKRCFCLGTE